MNTYKYLSQNSKINTQDQIISLYLVNELLFQMICSIPSTYFIMNIIYYGFQRVGTSMMIKKHNLLVMLCATLISSLLRYAD